jgi:methionine sulfoxide reductase heme-binding subunit
VTDQLLWYTTRAAGAVSLVLLTGVVVLGVLSALRFKAAGWPAFLTTGLHRNVALVTLVFLALHVVTAVVDPFTNLGWLSSVVPFSSYYRTFWLGLGTIAAELLVAIVVTSLLRGLIGHTAWRVIHWLTYASWPIAVAHGLGTGTDAWSAWFFGLTCACVAAVGFAAVYRLLAGSRDPLAAARASFRSQVERKSEL